MNRRQAKRDACWILVLLIDSWLAEGAEVPGERARTPKDEARIEAAMVELREEMHRRGWRNP